MRFRSEGLAVGTVVICRCFLAALVRNLDGQALVLVAPLGGNVTTRHEAILGSKVEILQGEGRLREQGIFRGEASQGPAHHVYPEATHLLLSFGRNSGSIPGGRLDGRRQLAKGPPQPPIHRNTIRVDLGQGAFTILAGYSGLYSQDGKPSPLLPKQFAGLAPQTHVGGGGVYPAATNEGFRVGERTRDFREATGSVMSSQEATEERTLAFTLTTRLPALRPNAIPPRLP